MKRFVKGDDDRNDDNDDDGETTRPSQQTRLHWSAGALIGSKQKICRKSVY